MFKRFAVIAALTLASAVAIALPKPSEVKAAVAAGNYAKAEGMLKEVLQERPTARVHYDLGQVYAYEGKHELALSEFRQAQVLDPTLKFASSAAEFTKKLATEQNLVAPPPPVVVAQPYTVPSIPSTAAVATAPVQHDGGGSVLPALLLILIVGGVAVGAFFVVTGRKQKKQEEDAATAAKREKNSTLLGFSKSLEDATLICKSATYDDYQKRQILDRIATLQTTVRSMIADLKDGKEVSSSRLATLESNVDTAVEQANNGIPAPKPAPAPAQEETYEQVVARHKEAMRAAPAPVERPVTRSAPRPAPRAPAPAPVVEHHYHTVPAPAPVVVNNNDGLLTGVILGSMMGHHDHERVVEKTVYVDRTPVFDTSSQAQDTYEAPAPAPYFAPAPAPAPTWDSGSDSRDSYEAPAPSPSVDTSASADDDTY